MIESVDIKDISGNIRFSTPINEGSKRKFLLMKEDYITLKFSLDNPIYFELGDWIDNELGIFELVDLCKPTYNTTTGGYDYELRLDAYYWKWKNKKFFYTPQTSGREASWNLTAPLDKHLEVFLDNLKALGYKFRAEEFIPEIDNTVENASKLVSYDNVNLIDALTQMAETWECEWWIENHRIRFGRCEFSSPVDFKLGDLLDTENVNVNSMQRSDSQTKYATRVYAFGSTRNIPDSYRKSLIFDVKEVKGRDISDTERMLKPEFFPSSSMSWDYYPFEGHLGSMIFSKGETKYSTTVAESLSAGTYYLKKTSDWILGLRPLYFEGANVAEGWYGGYLSICYNCGDRLVMPYSGVTSFNLENDIYEPVSSVYSDVPDLIELNIPEEASNLRVELRLVVTSDWSLISTVHFGASVSFKFSSKDKNVDTSVSFLSGVHVGEKLPAICVFSYSGNGQMTDALVRLPEGVTASLGDRYIVNNIIKGKVPDNYFSKDDKELTLNGVVQKRLMLPDGIPYIDAYKYSPTGERIDIGDERYDNPDNVEMPIIEAIEEIVVFEDEYPKYIGSTVEVPKPRMEQELDEDENPTENKYPVYSFKDTGLKNFTKDFRLKGKELRLVFQTGKLSGLDFALDFKESDNTGTTFEIIPNEDYGRLLPDDALFPQTDRTEDGKPVPADTYILHGFDTAFISEQMLPKSEQDLLKRAQKFVKKSMIDPSTYDCEMDCGYIYNDGNIRTFEAGDKVNLINKAYFPDGRQSRIIGFEWPLDIPYDHPIYTVGETAAYSRIGEIESKLDSMTYKGQTYGGSVVGGGGTSVYVIGVNDKTLPSDRNTFSAKRVINEIEERAISRTKDDKAAGHIDFEKGLTSKDDVDIEGGLNVSKIARLSGGVVVVADSDYAVAESQKENPENTNVMATGLTEVPGGGGFVSSSLGEMDNTDESFDTVPDGNYMMQKRAGVFYPVKATATGGGTKLSLTFITPSNITAVYGKDTLIKYSYSSLLSGEETGEGIATYTLNGKQVASETIAQGEVSFNAGKYLSLGDNTLVIQVTDSYGATRKLTFKISAVSISVTSTFDDSKVYNGVISFPYIPLGAVEKTIHFILDGRETGTYVTSVSNRQQTYSIPAQSHGAHTLEVYATATINEVNVESDRIRFDIISVVSGNNTPIIASSFRTAEAEQFGTVLIPYIVYNPASTTSDITLWANGTVISEQTVDRTRQTWSYRAETPGALEMKITCGPASRTFNLTVSESEINVEPELADLVLFLTSVNRSNNEEGKNVWNYGEIFALLTAFNWATNGWIKTIDGFVALRVNGDARVTIPYNSFANDFRATGKTLEFEFETRDVTDYDAVILSCMNGNIGLEITAQKAVFKSEQSTIETQFKEDERVRVSFVIEKKAENRLIFVYINGEICGVLQYPEQDNFTQPAPVGITIGNSECTADIFNIRVYDNALNRYQLLDNYIADMDNLDLKRKLYARNDIYDDYGNVSYDKLANRNISFTIVGELPTFKGDKKIVTLIYEDREHPERSWTATNVQIDVQGTSSQYYPRKNFKVKCKDGFTMTQSGEHVDKVAIFEGEIPVNVFCFKADFAESSGVHNTGMARLVDYILRGMGFLTEAQKEDPRIRTTVNGRPCVMWHQASENGEKVFQGKYNFNNDKSTNETFGFKVGCESWEIRNNTSDRVLFKVSDYVTVDADGNLEWLKDFEARYPDGNEDYTNLKRLTDWLVSVKNDPARFRVEADQYLDMDFMLSYYTITEFFAMVDQRAKNMFLTTFDGIHWILIFYDNDTCCSLNNEGASAFDYTVEYHDKIGNKDVWNGAGSTLWNNIEQAYSKEIAAMYADMRSKKILTYEECIRFLDTEQGDYWCEAVYNEDSWFKYVKPLLDEGNGSYLYAAQGSRKMHRRWWLYNRFKYMDSKYIAGDYKNDFATLRLYTPAEWAGVTPNADMNITSYAGQYVNVQYGSYTVGSRTQRNVPVHIQAPDIRFNDTETIIYGAGQISSLGDLSALYPGTVDVAKMTKLVELLVGSGVEGYRNTNLEVLSVGANNLLRKLDVRNCPNLKQAIDLSQCTNIREVWAEGTGTTAVVLPEGGNLTLLHLPDTVTNLTVRNQSQLNESGLSIAGVEHLSTIRWENTNGANVLSVIDRCFALDTPNLERIRIIGANWNLSTLDILTKLINLKGLDENGNNVDKAVVTGKCYVSVATDAQINKLKAAFPELTITYGQLKPMPVTTFIFSSSIYNKGITNSVFECDYEVEKVNEYTYKVTSEDNVTVDFTFKCENHEDFNGSYLVAGTRSQSYTVTYIPVRTLRVKVYNQSAYVQGATITIGDKTYISDADGYVTLPRGGGAISGTVSAYGYASNTFSFGAITNDQTNSVSVYGVVDVKFIVEYGSLLIEGATVKCDGVTGTTNQYGECTLSLGKGTYQYSVTHDSYYEKTGSVTVGTSATSLTVYVEPSTVEVKFVVKEDAAFLPGATVQCDGKSGITNASGEIILVIGSKKTHDYVVSKSGYFNVTGSVTVVLAATTVNANMTIDIESFKPVENGNIQMLVNGENVTLYVTSGTTDYMISWGDATEENATGTGDKTYTHVYGDSGFHQIEISNCGNVTYANSSYIVAYWSIGDSGVKDLSFFQYSRLKYVGLVLKNDTERTSFSSCFNQSGLTSIPDGLFDTCVKGTDFGSLFSRTPVESIPEGLFDHCIEALSFRRTFNETKITSIPENLFKYNTKAKYFQQCFWKTAVTSIPELLFYNCPDALSFGEIGSWYDEFGCFAYTLIESVPENLFINNKKATSFAGCFSNTRIKAVPGGLFTNNIKAYDFRYCFSEASIEAIPAGLLDNCPISLMDYFCDSCPDLKYVVLPTSVSSISTHAFNYCNKMRYIIATTEVPQEINSTTFSSTNNCPIYVPDASVDAYKTATNWTALADRIKPMSQFATDFPNEEV